MVIANSDSCNTLVSLDNDRKPLDSFDPFSGQHHEYRQTELYLVDDMPDYFDAKPHQALQIPVSSRVDEALRHIPRVVESCDEFLANDTRYFSQTSRERILYVAQGEAAHAVPLQCDVIVSDQATTCHILAIRSLSDCAPPLTSMAHIDGTSYESCVRAMFQEHRRHHHEMLVCEEKKDDLLDEQIEIQIHILGGFDDPDSASQELSNWLMHLLADIAAQHSDFFRMSLKTCAVSSLNDSGYSRPIGRGLGIDLMTGDAFLARVDPLVAGPEVDLRSVRVWSQPKSLSVIHTAKNNEMKIEAFTYQSFAEVDQLIHLPDDALLHFTSTSPDAEDDSFCHSVRSTLCYLRDVECTAVFGPSKDKALIFRRSGRGNNWKAIQ